MASLTVRVAPQSPQSELAGVQLQVQYTREIEVEGSDNVHVSTTRTAPVSAELTASMLIGDYASDTTIQLELTTSQGLVLVGLGDATPVRESAQRIAFRHESTLTDTHIQTIRDGLVRLPPPENVPLVRRGKFMPIGFDPGRFRQYSLLAGSLKPAEASGDAVSRVFGSDPEGRTRSISASDIGDLASLPLERLQSVEIQLDGEFRFSGSQPSTPGVWIWLLSGPHNFVGLQSDAAAVTDTRDVIVIPLALERDSDAQDTEATPSGESSVGRPMSVSEAELLEEPGFFSDDPGTFCRPFTNPNRIVSEKTFHTILRVEQPDIGGLPSVEPPDNPHPGGFFSDLAISSSDLGMSRFMLMRGAVRPIGGSSAAIDAVGDPMVSTRAAVALRRESTLRKSRGRIILDAENGLDWEGDSSPYQATTLAFGHILESRVRWRSNGYSLGQVAHTLTLAPRQTKRLLTVKSRIQDEASRRERTESRDRILQSTDRQRQLEDVVSASLREWASGGSTSSTTAGAGGFGFATAGFVIGGGGAHGRSSSDSWQRGGRGVSAREEQSLRDAIRQYGESLRAAESMVVVEQSQEESVQAMSETVRNPNYCHSLTVIYHQILRHLRIDTETVGVRECVYVPLAIRVFTLERALRWRDILERSLLKAPHRWVMRHLRDVTEGFVNSDIPAGARSTHPMRFVSGSLTLQLAIERPSDNEEDSFDENAWRVLAPFLGVPARGVFERLKARIERERDRVFQDEHAPTIAARWVDTLKLQADAKPLPGADFTLTSPYAYNRDLQVHFRVDVSNDAPLTRRDLEEISVSATASLPPGSVARVKQVRLRYDTDHFSNSVSSTRRQDDLTSTDGTVASEQATYRLSLTPFEEVDLRAEIIQASAELIDHLNEHIEYYHKAIWWSLDRDKLFMMLDSLQLRPDDTRSVASVVEHEPVAIVGNSLVYPVAGGAFVGVDGHQTPADLQSYYVDGLHRTEPIRISLPTSGLYAQAIMDDCNACEEHFGSTDWILTDDEPSLAELDASMLTSRRAAPPSLQPTPFQAPIINLQNAPDAPDPTGLAGVLAAAQNAGAFRDMAGLAGTQANARAGLETAAGLASGFAAKAVELRRAQMATNLASQKLDVIGKAVDKGLVSKEDGRRAVIKSLENLNVDDGVPLTREKGADEAIRSGRPFRTERRTANGTESLTVEGTSDSRQTGVAIRETDAGLEALTTQGWVSTPYGFIDRMYDDEREILTDRGWLPAPAGLASNEPGIVFANFNATQTPRWRLGPSDIPSWPTGDDEGLAHALGRLAFWQDGDDLEAKAFLGSLKGRSPGLVTSANLADTDVVIGLIQGALSSPEAVSELVFKVTRLAAIAAVDDIRPDAVRFRSQSSNPPQGSGLLLNNQAQFTAQALNQLQSEAGGIVGTLLALIDMAVHRQTRARVERLKLKFQVINGFQTVASVAMAFAPPVLGTLFSIASGMLSELASQEAALQETRLRQMEARTQDSFRQLARGFAGAVFDDFAKAADLNAWDGMHSTDPGLTIGSAFQLAFGLDIGLTFSNSVLGGWEAELKRNNMLPTIIPSIIRT